MQIRQADQHMQTSLRAIAKRAKQSPRHRFGNLYSLLNVPNLKWCYGQLNRKAAPGVDAVNYQAFKSDLSANLSHIVQTLKQGSYKARLIRRRYIPKQGGRRPLGIPVVGDKVVQTAAAQILTAIYEQDFLPCSHGYRRAKGPQRAALDLSQRLHRGRFGWVIDADIKGFFDNIDHGWLIRMLEQRIEDRSFLRLIVKWLKAGVVEQDGKVIYPVTGTPQGGVVSAVLANIYLHYALDLWFEKVVKPRCAGDAMMIRFADDFVCCFQYRRDAVRCYDALDKRMGRFKLELSKEKTRMIRFSRFETRRSKVFTFLGFEYRWGLSRAGKPLVRMRTAKNKFKMALSAILGWIKKEHSRLKTATLLTTLRQKLLGHWNYYGVSGNMTMLRRFYRQVCAIVYKWLNRRSQRKSCNWQGYKMMLEHFRIPRPKIVGYWD